MDTQNDAIFEAGDTLFLKKKLIFGIYISRYSGEGGTNLENPEIHRPSLIRWPQVNRASEEQPDGVTLLHLTSCRGFLLNFGHF